MLKNNRFVSRSSSTELDLDIKVSIDDAIDKLESIGII